MAEKPCHLRLGFVWKLEASMAEKRLSMVSWGIP